MGKYIKSTSTYTLRKKVQNLQDGSLIYERDWTTLGERHKLSKGKTPIYNDGNFLFTRGSFKTPSKRNKPSNDVVSYTYDNIKDAKNNVNNVELNTNSNDLKTFAYFSSCVELVNSSLNNIVSTFPGCLYVTGNTASYDIDSYMKIGEDFLYILDNSFGIDIISKSVELHNIDLNYKYLCESYSDYEVVFYKMTSSSKEDGFKSFVYENGKLKKENTLRVKNFEVKYNFDDKCSYIKDQWYYNESDKKLGDVSPILITLTLEDDSSIKIYGYRNDNEFIYFCKNSGIVIKPVEEVIENYYNGLRNFEKQLLNRTTKPLFKNVFLKPVRNKRGKGYTYVKRSFVIPSIFDYCINISSPAYNEFYLKLIEVAEMYDELWSNNMYGKMIPESVRNFDWTYTKDYVEGDEEDNVEGGELMQKVIYFIARVFDECKQYIDGIRTSNKVTNDTYTNMPDALISDSLELHGWDVTSVIPIVNKEDDTNENNIVYLDDIVIGCVKEDDKTEKIITGKWYDSLNNSEVNSTDSDVKFMRKLLLSSKRIFQSKGTQESIDMIMGMFGFGRRHYSEMENIIDADNDKPILDDYVLKEYWYETDVSDWDDDKKNIIDNFNEQRYNYSYEGEEFPNLPLNIHSISGKNYIIPYFDRNKDYLNVNDDFYFQSMGGWGHNDNEKDINEYKESVSYLKVLSTVDDLLNVKSVEVNEGDIYYVIDKTNAVIKGFPNENDDKDIYSNYFYVNEGFVSTTMVNTWVNINLQDKNNKMTKKAEYLDSIINTIFGNNPHVGFGSYDDGDKYIEYMKEPFKQMIENNSLVYDDNFKQEDLKFVFEKIEENYDVEETGNTFSCKGNNDIPIYELNKERKLFNFVGETSDEYEKRKEKINTKVVLLENKHTESDLYKIYFKNVMLPYIMQVIPSTTILILKDF